MDKGYQAPEIRDYGGLVELTAWKGQGTTEDGCGKTADGGTCSSPGAGGG
jgi:hypothetical protein